MHCSYFFIWFGQWKILVKLLYYWMVSSLLRQEMWFSCKLCFQFEQSTWTIDSSRIWSWRKLANACAAVLHLSWRCTLMTMIPVLRRKRVSLPTQVHSILMCCVTQRQHKWNRSSEMPGTKPDWLQKARVFYHVIFIFEWTLHFFHLSSLRQLRLAGLCLQKEFCFYILKHYVYLFVDVLLLGQKIAKNSSFEQF